VHRSFTRPEIVFMEFRRLPEESMEEWAARMQQCGYITLFGHSRPGQSSRLRQPTEQPEILCPNSDALSAIGTESAR
jgi:hypothetical protein